VILDNLWAGGVQCLTFNNTTSIIDLPIYQYNLLHLNSITMVFSLRCSRFWVLLLIHGIRLQATPNHESVSLAFIILDLLRSAYAEARFCRI
jgi:hypothetical protein